MGMMNPVAIAVTPILAQAEPALLMSLLKPLVMVVAVLAWARMVVVFDNDMVNLDQPRPFWNGLQLASGLLGFGLWLVLPMFWSGMTAASVTIGAAASSYIYFRNGKAPIRNRWGIDRLLTPRDWPATSKTKTGPRPHINLISGTGKLLDVPSSQDPLSGPHHRLEELLGYAFARQAQRIDIKANSKTAAVAIWIDGVAYPQVDLIPTQAVAVIDYVKHGAGLNADDRRRKLTGTLRIDTDQTGRHELAVTTCGSMRGLEMMIDIDPSQRPILGLDQLGLLPLQKSQVEAITSQRKGVVLAACPAGHGCTTLLYSLLARYDPYTTNIITIEQQPLYDIEGVNQQQIDMGASAEQLNSRVADLLKQAPQVLMAWHLINGRVARMLAETARNAPVYVGQLQEDTFTGLREWVRLIGDRQAAADALVGIFAGRLLRKLCTTCRVPYTPDPDMLRKLSLSPDRVTRLYKHSGKVRKGHRLKICPDCMGLGYRGRVGVFEVMSVDDQARRLIVEDNADALRGHLRKQKTLWLQEAAMAKVLEGTTAISEITRVLGQQAKQVQEQPA